MTQAGVEAPVPPDWLPPDALVLLVGPSGAGKSTWARRHFPAGEILASDDFRAMVAGDATDQSASGDAFGVLHTVVRARTRRGLRSVVDATNLSPAARRSLLRIARRPGRPGVAVVFDVPLARCLEWNASRPGRRVDEAVVREQYGRLAGAAAAVPGEGFSLVRVIREEDLVGE